MLSCKTIASSLYSEPSPVYQEHPDHICFLQKIRRIVLMIECAGATI